MKPVIGIYDQGSSKMTCIPMDEKDYSKLADGRSIETSMTRVSTMPSCISADIGTRASMT